MRRRPSFTRTDRISSLMKDEVKRIIEFELSSPLARHICVTDTKLSADMGHLRIRFVMNDRPTDADDEAEEDTFGVHSRQTATGSDDEHGSAARGQLMLDRSAGYVARVLCNILQLRKAPKVVFSYDKDYAQMKRVRVLLNDERRAATASEQLTVEEHGETTDNTTDNATGALSTDHEDRA